MDLRCLFITLVSVILVQGLVNTTSTNVTNHEINRTSKKNMTDLTNVSWAHAVNSRKLLDTTLRAPTINMIEADVLLGKVNGNGSVVPIMGHPPQNTSDLSLQMFLLHVTNYNARNVSRANDRKGIKLDFKSIEAFNASKRIILEVIHFPLNYPFWLNADILRGPSPDNKTAVPVNPDMFLEGAKQYTGAVLSLGWTTNVDKQRRVVYTAAHVDEMHRMLMKHHITQNVTFAVRAGVAADSTVQMKRLLRWPNSTLTIWLSNSSDPVSILRLRTLIQDVGRNRTYLDVPADLKKKLAPNSASVGTCSLAALLMICFVVVYQQFMS